MGRGKVKITKYICPKCQIEHKFDKFPPYCWLCVEEVVQCLTRNKLYEKMKYDDMVADIEAEEAAKQVKVKKEVAKKELAELKRLKEKYQVTFKETPLKFMPLEF